MMSRASSKRESSGLRAARMGWRRVSSLGGTLTVLVVFEILARSEILPSRYLPAPSTVAASLVQLLGGGQAWMAIGLTLLGWALGLGIAIIIAVPLGMLLGTSELAYRATRAIVEFMRPVPSVALVPLTFLIFKPGTIDGKVFLAAFAAIWPLLVQTIYGVRSINPLQIATAQSFQIGRWETFTRVVLPGSVPYLATGVRISSSVALILAVTGEIITGAPGIGLQINLASEGGVVNSMYAYVVIAGALGLALNSVFAALERRVLHWHSSHRMAAA
jgi:ABC-type nitrate/sulfonate/bicarbonate transport system permease component